MMLSFTLGNYGSHKVDLCRVLAQRSRRSITVSESSRIFFQINDVLLSAQGDFCCAVYYKRHSRIHCVAKIGHGRLGFAKHLQRLMIAGY